MARFEIDASTEAASNLSSQDLNAVQALLLEDPRAIAPEVRYVEIDRRLKLRFQVDAGSEPEAHGIAGEAIDHALVGVDLRSHDSHVEITPGAE